MTSSELKRVRVATNPLQTQDQISMMESYAGSLVNELRRKVLAKTLLGIRIDEIVSELESMGVSEEEIEEARRARRRVQE